MSKRDLKFSEELYSNQFILGKSEISAYFECSSQNMRLLLTHSVDIFIRGWIEYPVNIACKVNNICVDIIFKFTTAVDQITNVPLHVRTYF